LPYPRRLLHDDEAVIVELRPHPVRLVRPIATAVIVSAAATAGFLLWRTAPLWFGVALGGVTLMAVLLLVGKVVSWRATLLVVTSSRVVYRTGVLRRIGREIPVDRVQDVTYEQRLFERLVGAGTLTVESGGERGAMSIPDIRRPAVVQSKINRATDATRRPPASARSDREPLEDQIARLGEFHRRGVLTDAEYAAKRRELLDGM
jgi:uncharacterized membrane protein YdbT with pleckstrin-like domain